MFGWHFSFHAEGVETSERCASWTIARDATYFDADEGRDEHNVRPWIAFSWTRASARDSIERLIPRKSAVYALYFRPHALSSLPRPVSPIPTRAHLVALKPRHAHSNWPVPPSPSSHAFLPCLFPCFTRRSHVPRVLLSSTNGTVGLSRGPLSLHSCLALVVNPSPTSQRWCSRGWRTTMAT